MRRFPWWVGLIAGAACVAVGAVLTMRPFTSLGALVWLVGASFVLTGLAELVSVGSAPRPAFAVVVGLGWSIAGVVVVTWAAITIHALAIVVGISLVVGGLARLVAVIRARADDRLFAGLTGLASVVFGVLALRWVDVTVLVIALLVGPATVLFGLGQVAAALRRRRGRAGQPVGRPRPAWLRGVVAAGCLTVRAGAACDQRRDPPLGGPGGRVLQRPGRGPVQTGRAVAQRALHAGHARRRARGGSSTRRPATTTRPRSPAGWSSSRPGRRRGRGR